MNPDDKKFRFNYQPGRSIETLEQERLAATLKLTPEQRFRVMMQLIRISQKTREAVTKMKTG